MRSSVCGLTPCAVHILAGSRRIPLEDRLIARKSGSGPVGSDHGIANFGEGRNTRERQLQGMPVAEGHAGTVGCLVAAELAWLLETKKLTSVKHT